MLAELLDGPEESSFRGGLVLPRQASFLRGVEKRPMSRLDGVLIVRRGLGLGFEDALD